MSNQNISDTQTLNVKKHFKSDSKILKIQMTKTPR